MSSIMNISREDIDTHEKCKNYTVSIIECGKIGVPHACLFADAGFKVVGVNTNPHVLKLLRKGRAPFLKKAHRRLRRYVKDSTFTVSSEVRKTTSESDIIVIATETTIDRKKRPDYSLLEKTCKEVGMGLRKGAFVLFVSTTGPGTVENSMREILEKTSGLKAGMNFGLAFSPAQTSFHGQSVEGNTPPRVVSAIDESSLRTANLILTRIAGSDLTEVSSIKAAEAVNLFQKAKSETNLALANEFALLCEKLNIDFREALKTANKGSVFHLSRPGIVDGSLRKDFYLLLEEAENVNMKLRLPLMARRVNDEIADYTVRLMRDALKVCGKTVRRAKVSVLGVSRFPNAKEPPGIMTKKTINLLKKKVRSVQVYDPFFSRRELTELGFEAERLSKVAEKTDCIVILVGHSKFERLNLKRIRVLARKSPAIVDLGYVIDPVKAEKYGFVYRGLGRGVWTK